MKKTLLVAVAMALAVSSPAAAVGREEQRGLAGPGSFALGYLTPTITISQGDTISFTNFDVFEHDIVQDVEADGFGGKRNVAWCKKVRPGHEHHADACPVFWSELVARGATTQVLGLNRVKAGKTYSFFCTEHHSMKGKLVVSP